MAPVRGAVGAARRSCHSPGFFFCHSLNRKPLVVQEQSWMLPCLGPIGSAVPSRTARAIPRAIGGPPRLAGSRPEDRGSASEASEAAQDLCASGPRGRRHCEAQKLSPGLFRLRTRKRETASVFGCGTMWAGHGKRPLQEPKSASHPDELAQAISASDWTSRAPCVRTSSGGYRA